MRLTALSIVVLVTATALTGCGSSGAHHERAAYTATRAAPAAPALRGALPLSRTYQLSPSGPLKRPQTVMLPLTRRVPSGWAVVVAAAQSPGGPWTYLPARLSASRRSALFTTSHHSLFTILGEDVRELAKVFRHDFLDELDSGATASAARPSCSGQSAAEDKYSIQSSPGPTIYRCLGTDASGQPVLRIVDNRRYPIELAHPGLTETEHPHIDLMSLASVSHFLSGRESVLAPGEQIGYRVDIAPGREAIAQTQLDGFGESLFALQTGIDTLLAILTRFGAGGAAKPITVLNKALGDVSCADALGSGNPGSILASCFSPKDLIGDFGTAGWLLAPIAAAGAVTSFFVSEFQSLHDVWTNRDRYTIIVRRLATPPCSASLLFAAAVAAQHFSTNPRLYPSRDGPGPGAYNVVCDGSWALAAISHPKLGTQDSFTLFKAQVNGWAFIAQIGGFFGDCNLERYGVPAAVAKVLWPSQGLPPSETCP